MAAIFEARRSRLGRLFSAAAAIFGAAILVWLYYIFPDWGSRGGVGFIAAVGLLYYGIRESIFPLGNQAILVMDDDGIFDRRIMLRAVKWHEVLSLTDKPDYRGKALDIDVTVPDALAKSSFTRSFEAPSQAGNAKIVLKGLDRSAAEIKAYLAARMTLSTEITS